MHEPNQEQTNTMKHLLPLLFGIATALLWTSPTPAGAQQCGRNCSEMYNDAFAEDDNDKEETWIVVGSVFVIGLLLVGAGVGLVVCLVCCCCRTKQVDGVEDTEAKVATKVDHAPHHHHHCWKTAAVPHRLQTLEDLIAYEEADEWDGTRRKQKTVSKRYSSF